MQFKMNRDSGIVEFIGLEPNSKIKITLPNKDASIAEADKKGNARADFSNIRKKFLRQVCIIEVSHPDYETIEFLVEVRATKLIPKQITKQTKKG